VDGVRYAVFLAPGLLAAWAMETAIVETTWPVMGAIKWHRIYYAMLATPLTVTDVLVGHLGFVAIRHRDGLRRLHGCGLLPSAGPFRRRGLARAPRRDP